MNALRNRLAQRFARRKADAVSGGLAGTIDVGLETLTAGAVYDWNGLERGGDRKRPRVLLQITLEGAGQYRTGGRWKTVGVGSAFTAVIPSPHHYRFPPNGERWTFFWLLIHHEEVVKRLTRRVKQMNRVWTMAEFDPLLQVAEEVFSSVTAGEYQDPWLREEGMFRFMLALERRASGGAAQHGWEAEVARRLAERWSDPPEVTKVARGFGLSRSAFSHAFRQKTGQSPARYMRDLRVAEAARMLKGSRKSVKEIAVATGFHDAAQLAKAFRATFAVSPLEYRRAFGG